MFYNSVIENCLTSLLEKKEEKESSTEDESKEEKLIFMQYRGHVTEKFAQSLRRIGAPCKVVFTIRKLKTVLPSLKPPVTKCLKSGLVYKIQCSRCMSCYVGQTTRHLITRFKEHLYESKPVGKHMKSCNYDVTIDDVTILSSNSKSMKHLMILEALFINELRPTINTRDEYKQHKLVIKI